MNITELTWPEIAALVPHTPVVVPVAAVEQHGRHLPLATDSMLLGEVVRRVEHSTHERVLFAPLQWLGNSHHHMEYAGTLSASPRVYLDLLNDLLENLLAHGFRRILFLNGHGGNITPGKQAIMLSTMCGHGILSINFAQKMMSFVKENRRTPKEAAETMARFCSCGIFNTTRARRILEDVRVGVK